MYRLRNPCYTYMSLFNSFNNTVISESIQQQRNVQKILKKVSPGACANCNFHSSPPCLRFYEQTKKGKYGTAEQEVKKMPRTERIRLALKTLKEEIKVWKSEMKEALKNDPGIVGTAGDPDILFEFDTPEKIDKWIVTADSDHNEGFSKASFTTTSIGTGLFSGTLNSKPVASGAIKRSGYCNITSQKKQKSFKRDSAYEWGEYTHIVLKVRGDGRTYLINLACCGYYDVSWNDVYHYVLYTRGGPYWQEVKIPFSKFFFGHKGRVQDLQKPISLTSVTSVGFTAADKIDGPFQLEIDYIGLEFDPNHREEFAYEDYYVGRFIVAT